MQATSLLVLGVTALVTSRTLFWFFNDSEGPNLLIVIGMALILFALSLAAYSFLLSGTIRKKLGLAVLVQVALSFAAYLLLS